MIEITCADVRDSAPEFALDILPSEERSVIAAHMLRCPACRLEVESMQNVGTRLLELVPGTEPPLGFDRRVMARVNQPQNPFRRRYRMIMTVAAAAAIAAGATLAGVDAGRSSHTNRVMISAALMQGHRSVGEVEITGAGSGGPPWVTMTVKNTGAQGRVTCEVIGTDGSVNVVGHFELYHGGGSWQARDTAAGSGASGVRLVDGQGRVIAAASFT